MTMPRQTTDTKLKNYRFPFQTIDQLERLASASGVSMTKVLVHLIEQAEHELQKKEEIPEAA